MAIGGTEGASLPHELLELLLELAAAVNRYATYPAGHPSLEAASAALSVRVSALLRTRDTLSVGVARRQLVVEGVPTDASHPLLRTLAERLHRQHLGAIVIRAGATEDELRALLELIARASESAEVPLGLGDPRQLQVSERVRLYRLSFSQLQLLDVGAEGEGAGGGGGSLQAAQLWVGLARAALARAEESEVPEADDPDAVASAINGHPVAPAYDQLIVGYLSQLAAELRSAPAAGGVVRHRVSRLVSQLDPATLARLVSMGGDVEQRRSFLLNATDALATRSVIDLVQAASQATEQNISTSMLRLLTKLSAYSESGGSAGARAGEELRSQVRSLVDGWSLADPNPFGYTHALEGLGRTTRAALNEAAAYPPEPLRLVQMSLEADAVGPSLLTAVDALLHEGALGVLLDALEACDGSHAAAEWVWQHLEAHDAVRALLTTDPVDFGTLDRILVRLPRATVTSLLLDRLSESSSRATRMGVLQRLARVGDELKPAVLERLEDARWYVQRNMLALLNELGATEDVDALRWGRHESAAVRREAILLALRTSQRERALGVAFTDAEERVVRVGIHDAQARGLPPSVLPLALNVLGHAAFSPELRLQLLRVLRTVPHPGVRDALLAIAAPGRSLLGRPRLAPRSPEVISALAGLAAHWSGDPRVQAVLERARASGDPELAQAAGGTS